MLNFESVIGITMMAGRNSSPKVSPPLSLETVAVIVTQNFQLEDGSMLGEALRET